MMVTDPTGGSAASTTSTSKRLRRRVDDTSRKRSVQSCDFCRKRRCRCVPQPAGDGCLMCQSQGLSCSYTLPRKARFYGSVEDLSDRFKCLEAIVRGAFPHDPIATVAELCRLGERLNISMPDLNDSTNTRVPAHELLSTGPPASPKDTTETADTTTLVTNDWGFSMPSMPHVDHSISDGAYDLLGPGQDTSAAETLATASTVATTCVTDPETSHDAVAGTDDASIGLVRDVTGQEHFIGSSGSLQFLGQLRRLLLLSQHNQRGAVGANGTKTQSRLSTTFTDEDAAQSLEADATANEDAPDQPEALATLAALAEHQAQPPPPLDGPSPGSVYSAMAREYACLLPQEVDAILAQLPGYHVLDRLVRVYFRHIHPDFPLFHRGSFEEEYERFVPRHRDAAHLHPTRRRADPAAVDPGWLACLHMMLAFASLVATRPSTSMVSPSASTSASTSASMSGTTPADDTDLAQLRAHCVALTRFRLLPHLIARCTLANVRALLLLSLYLHNHSERNAAWNLLGTAIRASFAMGLHRTVGEEHFRPVEREVRRQVFCTLFAFEQFLASSLGRPSGIASDRGLLTLGGLQDHVPPNVEVEVVPPRTELLDSSMLGGVEDDDDDGAEAHLVLRLQTILAQARVSAAVQIVGPPAAADSATRPTLQSRLRQQEACAREIVGRLDAWHREVARIRGLDIPLITEADANDGPDGDLLLPRASRAAAMDLAALQKRLTWQSRPRLRAAIVLHMQSRYIAVLATRASLLRFQAAAYGPSMSTSPSSSRPPAAHDASLASIQSVSNMCVDNAVQLCRLVLLADAFGLVNGIAALDVFYAYCGAMVLILRSLWSPVQQEEAPYYARLRGLIARTREVLMRVDKCSTMKRFAGVVVTFEEGSSSSGAVGESASESTSLVRSRANGTGDGLVSPHRERRRRPLQRHADGYTRTSAHMPAACRPPSSTYSYPYASAMPMAAPGHESYDHTPFSAGMSSSADRLLGSHPNFISLFGDEPGENQWMLDTFIGMGEPVGSLPMDWEGLDSFMRSQ